MVYVPLILEESAIISETRVAELALTESYVFNTLTESIEVLDIIQEGKVSGFLKNIWEKIKAAIKWLKGKIKDLIGKIKDFFSKRKNKQDPKKAIQEVEKVTRELDQKISQEKEQEKKEELEEVKKSFEEKEAELERKITDNIYTYFYPYNYVDERNLDTADKQLSVYYKYSSEIEDAIDKIKNGKEPDLAGLQYFMQQQNVAWDRCAIEPNVMKNYGSLKGNEYYNKLKELSNPNNENSLKDYIIKDLYIKKDKNNDKGKSLLLKWILDDGYYNKLRSSLRKNEILLEKFESISNDIIKKIGNVVSDERIKSISQAATDGDYRSSKQYSKDKEEINMNNDRNGLPVSGTLGIVHASASLLNYSISYTKINISFLNILSELTIKSDNIRDDFITKYRELSDTVLPKIKLNYDGSKSIKYD